MGLHLYAKFETDSDNFKRLSQEIKAFAEQEDLQGVVNATKVIQAKAEALEKLYRKFDQNLDSSVEEIEEHLDEKTGSQDDQDDDDDDDDDEEEEEEENEE